MRYYAHRGAIVDRQTGEHVPAAIAAGMLSSFPAIVVELGHSLSMAELRLEQRDDIIARVRDYARHVMTEKIQDDRLASVDAGLVSLVEQARRYVAEVVLSIVGDLPS